MSVRIRLRRIGRKKQPYYRLVVVDTRKSRDGAYIDQVGYYNPRRQPALLQIDLEKLDGWIARGAQLTESAASLVKKARRGGDAKVEVVGPGEAAGAQAGSAPAAASAEKPQGGAARGGEAQVEAAAAGAVSAEASAPAAEAEAPGGAAEAEAAGAEQESAGEPESAAGA